MKTTKKIIDNSIINDMKYDVFISYSSKDQKIAEGICGFLESNGIRCFVAYRDIVKGGNWSKAISNALEDSSMMVAVYSLDYNVSEQVDREIEIMADDKKPILTFRLTNERMTGTKKYFLHNLNWIDAFPNPNECFGELLSNIKKLLDKTDNSICDNINQTISDAEESKSQSLKEEKSKAEFGVINYDNGLYEGDIINGKRNGHGIFRNNNGVRYDGEWVNDAKHGHGILYLPNGKRYDGEWVNDLIQGHGIYYYPNGTKIEVDWGSSSNNDGVVGSDDNSEKNKLILSNDGISGKVICTFPDGSKYEGDLVNNKLQGYGILTYANGNRYAGQWANSKENGQGSYNWANGDKYEGKWLDGKMTGFGVKTWANGDKYEGDFIDGRLEGNGIFYYKNGSIKKGLWRGGVFVGQEYSERHPCEKN